MEPKPFTTFPRTPKGKKKTKPIQQVRFRDPVTGKRLTPISSDQTSKAAADRWAIAYITSGKLKYRLSDTFENFAKGWFEYDTCPYVQSKLKKTRKFSRDYADLCKSRLTNHILPFFNEYKLTDIRVAKLEAFLIHLTEKRKKNGEPYSLILMAQVFEVLSMMLGEAYRLELIPENFCNRVDNFPKVHRQRGAFILENFYTLFDEDRVDEIWGKKKIYRTLSLVAATCGLRQGEILGLTFGCVHDGYIDVDWQWKREEKKLGPPKNDSYRRITVPEITNKALQEYIQNHSNKNNPMGIIFNDKTDFPVDHKALLRAFYKALAKIGIDEATRKQKVLTFHSWRHTFNSLMVDGIGRDKTRNLTGHSSDRMTENYNHPELASLKEAEEYQNKIFRIQPVSESAL